MKPLTAALGIFVLGAVACRLVVSCLISFPTAERIIKVEKNTEIDISQMRFRKHWIDQLPYIGDWSVLQMPSYRIIFKHQGKLVGEVAGLGSMDIILLGNITISHDGDSYVATDSIAGIEIKLLMPPSSQLGGE